MIWQRLKRLWNLSKYDVKDETLFWEGKPIQNDLRFIRTEIPTQSKTAQFIPHIKKSPIEQINEVAEQNI